MRHLTKEFGPDSDLPRSPADLPEYASVKQDFSDAAMRINYVTFEMPGSNRFPGAATPERDGKVYIWDLQSAPLCGARSENRESQRILDSRRRPGLESLDAARA